MQVQNKNKYLSRESIDRWAEGYEGKPSPKNYIVSIESILRKDYNRYSFSDFSDKYALDADAFESARKRNSNCEETVDFVVGLANNKLIMVEAKLDVTNVDNIVSGVERKIHKTKGILNSSVNFTSYSFPSVVLLNDKNFNRNLRRYRNLRSNKGDINPMRVLDFYNEYFVAS